MGNKPLKIKSNYKFDKFLMYLIQDVTKRTSADIVNFFYELSNEVTKIGIEKRTGRGIHKKISDFFPKTNIPFLLVVRGDVVHYWGRPDKAEEGFEIFGCSIEVGFPNSVTHIDQDKLCNLSTEIMESEVLGGCDPTIPPFDKPVIRTPPIYRKLMTEYTGEVHKAPPKPKKSKK